MSSYLENKQHSHQPQNDWHGTLNQDGKCSKQMIDQASACRQNQCDYVSKKGQHCDKAQTQRVAGNDKTQRVKSSITKKNGLENWVRPG